MRNCKKNQRKMFYALYDGMIPILDENGFDTFESRVGYKTPVEFKASLSTGQSTVEDAPFGADVSYDRVLSTADTSLPIDENTLIWVKNKPTYNADGTVDESSADYKVAAMPLDGLNSLRIPIKRRTVTKVENVATNENSFTNSESEDDGF